MIRELNWQFKDSRIVAGFLVALMIPDKIWNEVFARVSSPHID